MPYQYLYLHVNITPYDGCTLIDSTGEPFTYDTTKHYNLNLDNYRVAQPFIVDHEFNVVKIIGVPSPEITWLKNRDEVKKPDCELSTPGITLKEIPIVKIKCPTCGQLH